MQKVKIGGILQRRGLGLVALTGIPSHTGAVSRIFLTLGGNRINVEFIVHGMDEQNGGFLTLGLDRPHLQEALSLLEGNRREIGFADIRHNRHVALVSIFGPHFRERPGIAGVFFQALDSAKINILAISTSISTCSCLVAEEDLAAAVAALSQAFELPGG